MVVTEGTEQEEVLLTKVEEEGVLQVMTGMVPTVQMPLMVMEETEEMEMQVMVVLVLPPQATQEQTTKKEVVVVLEEIMQELVVTVVIQEQEVLAVKAVREMVAQGK
jgi:hypothetical protein